ncbi:MAG: radical SAM protein [Oscillospiraceae bacterium]|nr:radical SAM protein [Oscillospiraceae bacterium]
MEYIPAKTILSGYQEQKSWFGCHYNMNLYRGCCHGCIYCDSRSECYGIDHFDQVCAKENALETLERELRAKRRTGIIHTGSMSDPYNPFERDERLTQGALEKIARYGFGVVMATKSDLVVRDIPLLQRIREHSPVAVNITITTAEDALGKQVEPSAPAASRRFTVLRKLSEAGIPAGVLLMPVLPWITDDPANIRAIVEKAAQAGAKYLFNGGKEMFGLTMRDRQREYFYARLDENFPGLSTRYRKTYGYDYGCNSPLAKPLWGEYTRACRVCGVAYQMADIISIIRKGYEEPQLSLF